MNECKVCGKPVKFPIMVHAACWETEVEKMAQVFCDGYCKWPEKCLGQEELEEHCDSCDLIHALNMGLGKYREEQE